MSDSISRRTLYLDPDLAEMFDALPPNRYSLEALPTARRAMADLAARVALIPAPASVSRQEVWIAGLPGEPDVRLLVYVPQTPQARRPAFLHFHGGGFVSGSADIMAPDHYGLAAQLGCVVVTVDYRLAPETAYPGQLNDGIAAFRWLLSQVNALGVNPARIGLGGESAGGGIAAALALKIRDDGEGDPRFLQLTYPMLDDRSCARPDPHPWSEFYTWSEKDNRFGWQSYLGDLAPGGDDVPVYAAPARAIDLAGLPPTYIATGTLELFLAEDLDFATRLLAAGVPVELHLYPGAWHGFERVPGARVTKQAAADRLAALRRFMEGR